MATYGRSGSAPPVDETAAGIATNAATIKSILDRLMWLRRRLASLTDQTVEPDDIRTEDAIRNTERKA
ncbi:MAG: hypothetical protein KKD77_23995 [Gammaproteobacteria bacterium]|nr:hypothetical protein [Gammaproteobacteria bacterium]